MNHVENKSTGSKEKGQISVPQLSKIVLHMIRPHITQMHIIRPHITQKINSYSHTKPLRDNIALFFTQEEYDTSLESSN